MARNLRIDCHNGGPIIYNQILVDYLQTLLDNGESVNCAIRKINALRQQLLLDNQYPEYVNELDDSGVSIMIRTVGIFADPSFSKECISEDIQNLKTVCSSQNSINYVTTSEQLKHSLENKSKAYIPMIESIENFENDLDILFEICRKDVPIVQPVYNTRNFFGSGCFDENDSGLSEVGRTVLNEMRKIGTIIDYSHISERTAFDILDSGYPNNIATHTFSSRISQNHRGKSDAFFQVLHQAEGFAAVTVNPNLISIKSNNTKSCFLANVEHLLRIIGEDNLGIGTDWDGPMPVCV